MKLTGKNLMQLFSSKNLTWNVLEKNSSIHCKNPASISLSHETVFQNTEKG